MSSLAMNRQKELRSFLRKNTSTKPLPSKLCEYNNKHQLICKICKTMVKSTTFWKTHERSTKHRQTLNHLLKLKAERDENVIINNIENAPKEAQKKELETEKEREKEENEEELLVDVNGIPLNFFDKSMRHKKPKHKKEIEVERKLNEDHNHFIVIESDKKKKSKNSKKIKLINENVDDTDRELLKLENDMKTEQNKKEDQLLQFVKEMDKKIQNQENKEIQFKIDKIKRYRNTFESYKQKRNFTELTNEKPLVVTDLTPNKKKRKITQKISHDSDSDSDFEEHDIFDLGDWRTQKI